MHHDEYIATATGAETIWQHRTNQNDLLLNTAKSTSSVNSA